MNVRENDVLGFIDDAVEVIAAAQTRRDQMVLVKDAINKMMGKPTPQQAVEAANLYYEVFVSCSQALADRFIDTLKREHHPLYIQLCNLRSEAEPI